LLIHLSDRYLNAGDFPRALHPRRDIDGVAPNIIVRFPRPDDASSHRSMINAHFQNEVIKTLLVDAWQGFLKFQSELHKSDEVAPSRSILWLHRLHLGYSRSGHVGRSYRLNFDDTMKFLLIEDLIIKWVIQRYYEKKYRRRCKLLQPNLSRADFESIGLSGKFVPMKENWKKI